MKDDISNNQKNLKRASAFISYSRADRQYAERVAIELRRRSHEVTRDLDDILPSEEWKGRLETLITEADVIVFLLSPKSAASEVCRWEVDLAQNLNKKIAPIVIEDIEGSQIPEMLSRLNYIFATERDRFDNAIDSLCDAINIDVDWMREHTRLTRLALQYEKAGNRSCDLLTERALTDAEKWLLGRPISIPSVAEKVIDYIEASRVYLSMRARYAETRLQALADLVEPMLTKEVESLQERASDLASRWQDTFVRADAEGNELLDRIKTIENFRSTGGRWHPQSAKYIKNAGAQGDYLEVYQFPCCDAWATLANRGEPLQFRADGCEEDPSNGS